MPHNLYSLVRKSEKREKFDIYDFDFHLLWTSAQEFETYE